MVDQLLKTYRVKIGNTSVGGGSPVRIQSMTDTDTEDISKTVTQIVELYNSGSELVRITVNSDKAAKAVPYIKDSLLKNNINVPLIGDFHFNGNKLLSNNPDCAKSLDKYRINPGNVGFGKKKDLHFSEMINLACLYKKPVRIGVNWGSLDQSVLKKLMDENSKSADPLSSNNLLRKALVKSALDSAQHALKIGLNKDKIIISCKVSNVQDLIVIYKELSEKTKFPLHLGLTEAGMSTKGIVSSSSALSILLQMGIGDTIRVSLTPDPNGHRNMEVLVCQEILQSLGLRSFYPSVISCPGCGRTSSNFFQILAEKIQNFLRTKMIDWAKIYNGVENLKVAVMGCVVNGPGESKHANIGISLPGSGENPVAPVFVDGQRVVTLKGDEIASEFKKIVIEYVEKNYSKKIVN